MNKLESTIARLKEKNTQLQMLNGRKFSMNDIQDDATVTTSVLVDIAIEIKTRTTAIESISDSITVDINKNLLLSDKNRGLQVWDTVLAYELDKRYSVKTAEANKKKIALKKAEIEATEKKEFETLSKKDQQEFYKKEKARKEKELKALEGGIEDTDSDLEF